ncbi:hypothetical protein C8R45DRAFT_1076165 [Mycena sanguinolenta]|nr:hypothetical protein C8R45DRAFT_1076165 [Mycena sanguinolenta]
MTVARKSTPAATGQDLDLPQRSRLKVPFVRRSSCSELSPHQAADRKQLIKKAEFWNKRGLPATAAATSPSRPDTTHVVTSCSTESVAVEDYEREFRRIEAEVGDQDVLRRLDEFDFPADDEPEPETPLALTTELDPVSPQPESPEQRLPTTLQTPFASLSSSHQRTSSTSHLHPSSPTTSTARVKSAAARTLARRAYSRKASDRPPCPHHLPRLFPHLFIRTSADAGRKLRALRNRLARRMGSRGEEWVAIAESTASENGNGALEEESRVQSGNSTPAKGADTRSALTDV